MVNKYSILEIIFSVWKKYNSIVFIPFRLSSNLISLTKVTNKSSSSKGVVVAVRLLSILEKVFIGESNLELYLESLTLISPILILSDFKLPVIL